MASRSGAIALFASSITALGCNGSPRPPATLAFMQSATYVRTLTGKDGNKQTVWKLEQPKLLALPRAIAELVPSAGWKTEIMMGTYTFYAENPKRVVALTAGEIDENDIPKLYTEGKVTSITLEGY